MFIFPGDLWGPLLLCTLMATMLQGSTERADDSNDGGPEFAEVFVLVWIGAAVVTLNSKLLGGNMYVAYDFIISLLLWAHYVWLQTNTEYFPKIGFSINNVALFWVNGQNSFFK